MVFRSPSEEMLVQCALARTREADKGLTILGAGQLLGITLKHLNSAKDSPLVLMICSSRSHSKPSFNVYILVKKQGCWGKGRLDCLISSLLSSVLLCVP